MVGPTILVMLMVSTGYGLLVLLLAVSLALLKTIQQEQQKVMCDKNDFFCLGQALVELCQKPTTFFFLSEDSKGNLKESFLSF